MLAACGAEEGALNPAGGDSRLRTAPVTMPDLRVDEIPTGEPGSDRRQWRPSGEPAVSLLGNLTASVVGGRSGDLVLAFANGVTARLERLADLRGQDRAGPQLGDFARVLSTDPRAGVFVYLVVQENRANIASGGLCRTDRPTFAALSEFVDASGQWVLRIAAFKGDAQPGPVATTEPSLCAVFNYVVNN
jgi:hypothetical protein